MKEQYVKREDFVIVKEKLIAHENQHVQLLKALEKMDRKLDNLERGPSVTTRRGR
jgi:hypothetical protein